MQFFSIHRMILRYTKIAEVIKEYDLDLLHMHYAAPHAICGILAREMSGKDIKIMTPLHGTDITVLGL